MDQFDQKGISYGEKKHLRSQKGDFFFLNEYNVARHRKDSGFVSLPMPRSDGKQRRVHSKSMARKV